MCQSMVNIQSPTAEIRRGKKRKKKEEEEEEEGKKQDENIMVCPITQGDHNKRESLLLWSPCVKGESTTVILRKLHYTSTSNE